MGKLKYAVYIADKGYDVRKESQTTYKCSDDINDTKLYTNHNLAINILKKLQWGI